MSDSDDIEIIESETVDKSVSDNNDICQLCPTKLHGLSRTERDEHYNRHIFGRSTNSRLEYRKPKPTSVVTSQPERKQMKFGKNAKNAEKDDVFWYPAQSKVPPDNYAPGVLSILKQALKESCKKGVIQRAVLCYERIPHIYRETFDAGWGCGYRNFLMASAALMDQQVQAVYFPHLDSPSPPSIRNLQQWIEDAWEHGYDKIGADELGHRLVNTEKQIGTGELYVAFTSRKIPCALVDIDLRECPKGFDTVVDWVVNHFTEKLEGDVNKILRATSPVVATNKMPVIMQYDGHSMTIVGYEVGKNNKNSLLVFDPSRKVRADIRQAALNTPASVKWASPSKLRGKGKRLGRSKSPPRKRSRTDQDPDDGVVCVPDSEEGEEEEEAARRAVTLESTLDLETVLKTFRLTKNFKKKQQFQLLYFTMGDPLSDQEQNDRKVVLAEC